MQEMIITNPRGVRAAWQDGLFDALCLSIGTLAGEARMTDRDRALVVVKTIKLWPDHAIVTMVDRVLMIEDTAAAGGRGTIKAMLAECDLDTLLVETMWRPILLATTLRELTAAEDERLIEAVRATGIDPKIFGMVR